MMKKIKKQFVKKISKTVTEEYVFVNNATDMDLIEELGRRGWTVEHRLKDGIFGAFKQSSLNQLFGSNSINKV